MPGKPVFGHVNPYKLTKNEKKAALEYSNLIKQKIYGRIKGRTCTNIIKNRRYLKDDKTVASQKV